MSVNGDLMVVRNGRSTSQVSVYNYPEHLNPFYEDDNHKRLRFWHINKSSKDGQGRRNSFSLGGLKDMWAFKSFRLKKKSSSLGINKTSESPPPLRRELYANENGYNTYDPRMRYTTGPTNGLGGANTAFQRNVPYRSSLQDMRNSQPEQSFNGIGFNRNDRYRSTIQTATTSSSPTQTLTLPTSRRYVYRGSVTPQPVRNLEFNSDSLGKISRGSSQASVASTNPFDDEDDDDVVMGAISASSTPAKHPARKKRRAPPPPIPVHQVIKEESSSAGSTPSHKPNTPQPKKAEDNEDERLEIHNLTAEIESFVKSSNADTPEREVRSTTVVSSKTPKQNGTIPKSHPTPARETNGSLKTNNVDIVITSVEEPLFIREEQDIEKHINSPKTDEKKELKEVGHVEVIHVHVENSRSTPERSNPAPVSSFRSEVNPKSPEKILTTQTKIESININEVKQSPDKPKPPIATKPSLPKSPPPLSRLSNTRGEVVVVERPVTPEMRRREIKIEEEISSSPETPHREMPIDVGNSQTSQPQSQEVTIQVQRIVAFTEDVKEEPSIVSIPATVSPVVAPVPAVRERKHSAKEQLSPLPAARKVLVTEKEINISKKQEEPISPPVKKELKFEENNSNLEEDFPTTVSELQLIISEVEEVAARFEEHETNATGTKEILPQLVEASTATAPKAHPAPIEKPPRAKHFVEEFNENIYRPRPSQWKESTLAPLAPVPPEKRRSVKQIIDSINQNQKLLGGAKKDDENEIDSNNAQRNQSETNTNAMEQNLKSLAESQREMKRMLLELEKLENAHEQKLSNKTDENFQGILDTIVSTLAKETNKNNETDVFKKCTITKEVNNASRESSPTASNLDWNPVPKPKRTINLSPELQVKKNNNNN